MKIDVSTITGYESMTPEQKLAALESYEIKEPTPDYTGYVKKDLFDKATSEIADWKKKYNSFLSEDEKAKQAHEEELRTLRETVSAMKREKEVAALKASYIAIGYSEELAEDSAQASVDNNITKVLMNQKTFLEEHDAALKSSLMDKTPRPPAGTGGTAPTVTMKDIMKVKDPVERQKLISEHMDLFE